MNKKQLSKLVNQISSLLTKEQKEELGLVDEKKCVRCGNDYYEKYNLADSCKITHMLEQEENEDYNIKDIHNQHKTQFVGKKCTHKFQEFNNLDKIDVNDCFFLNTNGMDHLYRLFKYCYIGKHIDIETLRKKDVGDMYLHIDRRSTQYMYTIDAFIMVLRSNPNFLKYWIDRFGKFDGINYEIEDKDENNTKNE